MFCPQARSVPGPTLSPAPLSPATLCPQPHSVPGHVSSPAPLCPWPRSVPGSALSLSPLCPWPCSVSSPTLPPGLLCQDRVSSYKESVLMDMCSFVHTTQYFCYQPKLQNEWFYFSHQINMHKTFLLARGEGEMLLSEKEVPFIQIVSCKTHIFCRVL